LTIHGFDIREHVLSGAWTVFDDVVITAVTILTTTQIESTPCLFLGVYLFVCANPDFIGQPSTSMYSPHTGQIALSIQS
jgi:hypothetical protein